MQFNTINNAVSIMSKEPKSYYDILQLDHKASDQDIKAAYRRLAMVFHPDRNPTKRALAEKHFQKLNEAYAAVNTETKRKAYNAKLKTLQAKKLHSINADNDNNKGLFAHIAKVILGTSANARQ